MKKSLFSAIAVGLCMTANVMAQVPGYVPSNGLVGWWPFNGNANDESGNGNNGTVNGATLTTDRFGNSNKAYYFSSSGCATYIDAQINTSTIIGELTVSFWANRTGDGCIAPRIMKFYAPTDGPGTLTFNWPNNSSNPSMAFVTSTTNSPFYQYNNVLNDTWAHFVYTNDGFNSKLYQDGVLLSTNVSSGTITLAGNANFGRMTNPAHDAFNGKLDDIGIWNRALTLQEITDLYNGTLGINNLSENSISIYPNPSNDHITIDAGDLTTMNGYSIKIEDAQGEQVFQNAVNQQQFYVDITSWGGDGLYFVRIIDPQGNTVDIKKIVLQ